jgi:hypothetical protein
LNVGNRPDLAARRFSLGLRLFGGHAFASPFATALEFDEGVGKSLPRRPWRVLAHERRQRLHDRPVFALALPGDTLERIDSAEAGLELVTAELFDRLGEAFGDPAFPICPGLLSVPKGRCLGLPQSGPRNSASAQECCYGNDVIAIGNISRPNPTTSSKTMRASLTAAASGDRLVEQGRQAHSTETNEAC